MQSCLTGVTELPHLPASLQIKARLYNCLRRLKHFY